MAVGGEELPGRAFRTESFVQSEDHLEVPVGHSELGLRLVEIPKCPRDQEQRNNCVSGLCFYQRVNYSGLKQKNPTKIIRHLLTICS